MKAVPRPADAARNDEFSMLFLVLEKRHGDALIPYWGYGSHRRLLKGG
jgi:hypothetical protein